jgi:hypothetical protein
MMQGIRGKKIHQSFQQLEIKLSAVLKAVGFKLDLIEGLKDLFYISQ